ncbi:MAG: hypothetical protein RR842_08150 [Gordonibacter sp.]|uniref:hypothetical protein n=1 Tax=Gordonibacter sp. TaxID=1968902 RepID=UPI002FC66CF8
MFRGKRVTVRRSTTHYDDDRNPIETWAEEVVDNVLVVPGATHDIAGVSRPSGTMVAFTLAFPCTYAGALRGCRVVISGEVGEYAVIGDPRPCRDNCPTAWWMRAEVEACNG